MACEDGALARTVRQEGGLQPWELRYGPFERADFVKFPSSGWTLLLQQVAYCCSALNADSPS